MINYISPCHAVAIARWSIAKINEEVAEVIRAAYLGDGYELALELQDVITVCTSWQAALGFDFGARQKVCAEVNEKNRRRGYLGE